MKRMFRRIIFSVVIVSQFAGCIGVGDDARSSSSIADQLPPYLLHALGYQKINELLHNPLDSVAPGLFIDDMLYLISKVNHDSLIEFVRSVESRRILKLVYNLKRMGCNKAKRSLNILLPETYSRCSLNIFNHLEIIVRMLNDSKSLKRLIQITNQQSLVPPISTMDAFLEKLAYLIIYIGSTDKVIQLLDGILDSRDVVFFIDRLDGALNVAYPAVGSPPASIAEIESGVKLGNMDSVLRVLSKLKNGQKIFELINGMRPRGADDSTQQAYLVNLTIVLQQTETEAGKFCPNDTSVTTLVELINNLRTAISLVDLIQKIDPNNVAALINRIAKNSQHTIARLEPILLPPLAGSAECGDRDNLSAGGEKLAAILNEIIMIDDLIFLVNNLDPNPVIGVQVLADLVGRLNVNDAYKLGKLLNDVLPVAPLTARYNYINFQGQRKTSTGIGKIINLLNGLDSGAGLVKLINNITDATKLPNLLNQTENSSNLAGFLNAIIRTPATSFDDLVDFLNTMDNTTGVPRLIYLIEKLNASQETADVINPSPVQLDVASIMAPQNKADLNISGIGTQAMATLLNSLNSHASVDRLVVLLNETGIYGANPQYNGNFTYNSVLPNISKREGLVRLIFWGVTYLPASRNINFPGLGAPAIATILNVSTSAANLISLLNASAPYTNITDVVVVFACGDRLPSHFDPCNQVGLGWNN